MVLTVATTAAAKVFAEAPSPRHHRAGTPILLQAGQTIRMAGTGIYCSVDPLLRLGNELFCYDARGRLAGSYGFELSSSGLAVLRFAHADKAHVVWNATHR